MSQVYSLILWKFVLEKMAVICEVWEWRINSIVAACVENLTYKQEAYIDLAEKFARYLALELVNLAGSKPVELGARTFGKRQLLKKWFQGWNLRSYVRITAWFCTLPESCEPSNDAQAYWIFNRFWALAIDCPQLYSCVQTYLCSWQQFSRASKFASVPWGMGNAWVQFKVRNIRAMWGRLFFMLWYQHWRKWTSQMIQKTGIRSLQLWIGHVIGENRYSSKCQDVQVC